MWTVISDLHLFSHRSRALRHMPAIVEALRQSEALILNGDIFDFNWSIHGGTEPTINAAEEWLRQLMDTAPHGRLYYLLGNHDGVSAWAERCEVLSEVLSGFHWSPDYLRLGDTLFTHGDLLLGSEPLETRPLKTEVRPRKAAMGRAYEVVSHLRIPRIATLCYPTQRCARVIFRNFQQLDPKFTDGVRRICMGHTHRPFSQLAIDGLEIYNTGSTIAGMPFRPLVLQVPEDQGVAS